MIRLQEENGLDKSINGEDEEEETEYRPATGAVQCNGTRDAGQPSHPLYLAKTRKEEVEKEYSGKPTPRCSLTPAQDEVRSR